MLRGPHPRHKLCGQQLPVLTQMAEKLKNVAKNIKNLTFKRRLKGVRIVKTVTMMVLATNPPKTAEEHKEIWGPNPVHPSPTANKTMADSIVEDLGCQPPPQTSSASAEDCSNQDLNRRTDKRESWTAHTQLVANRRGKWSVSSQHSSGPQRSRGHGRGRSYGNRGNIRRGGRFFFRPY